MHIYRVKVFSAKMLLLLETLAVGFLFLASKLFYTPTVCVHGHKDRSLEADKMPETPNSSVRNVHCV